MVTQCLSALQSCAFYSDPEADGRWRLSGHTCAPSHSEQENFFQNTKYVPKHQINLLLMAQLTSRNSVSHLNPKADIHFQS